MGLGGIYGDAGSDEERFKVSRRFDACYYWFVIALLISGICRYSISCTSLAARTGTLLQLVSSFGFS